MEGLIAVILVGMAVAFGVLLIAVELVFRRCGEGEAWRAVMGAEKAVRERVEAVVARVRRDEQEFAVATRRYEEGYVSDLLRRRPIRELRPRMSVSMSWAALERAGIRNLEQFLAFRGDFQQIHGIGEARGRALWRAQRELREEMNQTTLPMPTVRSPGSPQFDVVSRVVRVVDLRTRVRPQLEVVEEKMEAIRAERPSWLGVRRRFWLGDRTELRQALVDVVEEYRELGSRDVEELEAREERAGIGSSCVEELTEQYGERQEVARRIIDSATRRTVRGAVRPVGAAAIRAAEGFENEEDFCDRGLEPLIEKLGYQFQREFTIKRRIGSREQTMYVDFLLLDDRGNKVGILEAKRSIRTDRQLDDARQQALSYALFKELRPMMVAAPQGLWLYERRGQQTRFCAKYEMEEAYNKLAEVRAQIEALRG